MIWTVNVYKVNSNVLLHEKDLPNFDAVSEFLKNSVFTVNEENEVDISIYYWGRLQ